MNKLEDKLRIIILGSIISGIIALFFPQWYSGLYYALNESLILGANVRETTLALSMFSILILVITIIGLLKSIKKLQNEENYSLWATWVFYGILISLVPTIYILMCYNLCINFKTFSILGLELFFSYFSGGAAYLAGLITFCNSNYKKK